MEMQYILIEMAMKLNKFNLIYSFFEHLVNQTNEPMTKN
jgi:hypothetical protein